VNSKLILAAARGTLDGTLSFPDVVGKRLAAGEEHYQVEVDYVGLLRQYGVVTTVATKKRAENTPFAYGSGLIMKDGPKHHQMFKYLRYKISLLQSPWRDKKDA
jgi:hypothetical protein